MSESSTSGEPAPQTTSTTVGCGPAPASSPTSPPAPGAEPAREIRPEPFTSVTHPPAATDAAPLAVRFHRNVPAGREDVHVRAAIADGHLGADGPFTKRCQALLERELVGSRVLLTTSCTHALEIAAELLDLGPGDAFVVPAFAFVTTAAAFTRRGARPIFADIREDTLNLDLDDAAVRLTPDARALVALHYNGVPCEPERLVRLAAERGLALVEDNAHGVLERSGDRHLGGFGTLGALSFHATKSLTCGEGGALLVNEPQLWERARVVRLNGTDRARFLDGEVGEYTWVDRGSNYAPADVLAAYLYGQLEAGASILARRRSRWRRYRERLSAWAAACGVRLVSLPPGRAVPHHLFTLLLPDADARPRFVAHLRARGVEAVSHYPPLHLTAMGRRFGGRPGDCPVAESASRRLVRLPLYADLADAEQDRVIEAVLAFTAG